MTSESRRKLSHWCILVVPFFYLFILDKDNVLLALGGFTLLVAAFEALRQKSRKLNKLLLRLFDGIYRSEEMHNTSTLIYTLSGMLFTIFLFEKQIAVLAILFLTFGDGFAALAGERWGRHRVFKGTQKTWEGASANFIACMTAGLIYACFYDIGMLQLLAGAITVTFIELLPKTKDNILIPVFAALVMTIL